MQTLEKCMEDMKAIFKLNNEKLVFNFRVLREREIVNKAQKTMLRDKLMKIQNLVRAERLKYETQLSVAQKDNVLKTKKYKEFTNMFKDVQAQYARF